MKSLGQKRANYTSQAKFQQHNNPNKKHLTSSEVIDKALAEGKEIKVFRNNTHIHSWSM